MPALLLDLLEKDARQWLLSPRQRNADEIHQACLVTVTASVERFSKRVWITRWATRAVGPLFPLAYRHFLGCSGRLP